MIYAQVTNQGCTLSSVTEELPSVRCKEALVLRLAGAIMVACESLPMLIAVFLMAGSISSVLLSSSAVFDSDMIADLA